MSNFFISLEILQMPRKELAQHMQEFTQMHMRCMAEFLRSQTPNSCQLTSVAAHSLSDGCRAPARAQDSCQCRQELTNLRETVLELEGRLVRQDQQIRELCIHNETQKTRAQSYGESWLHWRRPPESWKPSSMKASTYGAWRTSHSTCAAKKPVNPLSSIARLSTLAGRGTNLCLRLHLQTPSAPRCSNYISLFVHTMQGEFDSQLSWPLQGTIRLAVLDQVDGQHHLEVMETKPDLQAFQRPTVLRNPKGFGYVTFLHLQALRQRGFLKDDVLLVRCEVTPHESTLASGGRGPTSGVRTFTLSS